MAWAFNKGDIPDIASIAQVHPDPTLWWTLVQSQAADSDVQALATEILAAYAAGGRGMIEIMEEMLLELRRVGDTENTLELTQIFDDGTGQTTEYQARSRGILG